MTDSRGHKPGGKWEFDEQVTECFEDMLERSIPQYAVMRQLVQEIGQKFVRRGSIVVDLGCSRGGALAPLVGSNLYLQLIGVEVSVPMAAAARTRFEGESMVTIEQMDLKAEYPDVGFACLTMAVLTLQFIPINYRQQILKRVFDTTTSGGAFIFVEKVLGNGAEIDSAMVDVYHRMKSVNGYTDDEIETKRQSLEGVLVPVTSEMNEQMLRRAGFSQVDCFWRCANFAGWVAIK